MLELQGFELRSRWSAGIEDGGVGEAHAEAEAPSRREGNYSGGSVEWHYRGRLWTEY